MKKDWENIPADSLPQELPKTILSTNGMPTAEKDADVNAHADAPSSEDREYGSASTARTAKFPGTRRRIMSKWV